MQYKAGDYVECIFGPDNTPCGRGWKKGRRFYIHAATGNHVLYDKSGMGVFFDWVKLIDPLESVVSNIKQEIGL